MFEPYISRLRFMTKSDQEWMRLAIDAAIDAETKAEVPVGACLVSAEGEVLALAGNRTRIDCDPTAHAEILVMRAAAKKIGNYRLTGTTLYTTIEPCAMCAGALVHARVKRLVFGALDERFGAIESVFRIGSDSSLNHQMEITKSVLAEECRKLMQDFFREKRGKTEK